ncbi:MAG: hypothetical protein WCI34_04880, partial [Actinomycetes bacterium]
DNGVVGGLNRASVQEACADLIDSAKTIWRGNSPGANDVATPARGGVVRGFDSAGEIKACADLLHGAKAVWNGDLTFIVG